jgi:phospholipase/lecithinase/hemolysin
MLYASGARKFLVPNLPDLSLTPGGSPGLQGATMQFNTLLAQQLSLRQGLPNMQLVPFDTFAAFNTIRMNAASYGIQNVEDECYGGPTLGLGFVAGVDPLCTTPNSHLFWDNVHPGSTAHALLGEAFADAVQPDAVPEPATMTLTGLGLGIAALLVRRRRAA